MFGQATVSYILPHDGKSYHEKQCGNPYLPPDSVSSITVVWPKVLFSVFTSP